MAENNVASQFIWVNDDDEHRPAETILIVDDDDAVQDMLSFKFDNKYNVESVDSGQECLEFVTDVPPRDEPDLILLDVMMPGRNGLQVLRDIRDINRYAQTPVIVITGSGQEDTATKAFTAGADDLIRKPFSLDELKARIRRLLS